MSEADLFGTYSLTWDDAYLYVMVRVSDDQKVQDSTSAWQDDGIEIFIDGNNDKATSYDDNDHQFILRWNDNTVHAFGGNGAVTDPAGIVFTQSDDENGYAMEVAIAWDTIGVSPSAGKNIGFEVQINDDDNGGSDLEARQSWFAAASPYSNPSLMGTVELSGDYEVSPPSVSPTPTPVATPVPSAIIDFGSDNGKIGQWWGSGTESADSIAIDESNASNGMAGFHSNQFNRDWSSSDSDAPIAIRIRVGANNQNTTLRLTLQDGQGRQDRWYFDLANVATGSWQVATANTALNAPHDGTLDVDLSDIREVDFVTEWITNDAAVVYAVDEILGPIASGEGDGDGEAPPPSDPPEATSLAFEAEDMSIQSPMQTSLDDGREFIETTVIGEGTASRTLVLAQAGQYTVSFVLRAPTGGSDSLFFTIGDNTERLFHTGQHADFTTVTFSETFTLPQGEVAFIIRGRERGTQIDSVEISCVNCEADNAPSDPQEPEPPTSPENTLTYVNSATVEPSDTSATIRWEMNNHSTGQVLYGTNAQNLTNASTKESSFNYAAHIQTISGLSPGTTYYFQVLAEDEENNSFASGIASFTTTGGSATPTPSSTPAPVNEGAYAEQVTYVKNTDENSSRSGLSVGQSFTEQYGTITTRVTDQNSFGGNRNTHNYSRRSVWNIDETMMKVGDNLMDPNTYENLGVLPFSSEANWSNTNPDLMYGIRYVSGKANNFSVYNVKSQQLQTITTFSSYDHCTIGDSEGNLSDNDRYIVFRCDNTLISFDIETKTILGTTATQSNFNWASVSRSGQWILVENNNGSDPRYVDRYDRNFGSQTRLTDERHHGDLGIDENGDDVLVMVSWDKIYSVRIRDKYKKTITTGDIGHGHLSCRNIRRPGYCYISSYAGPIYSVNLADGKVEHMGFTRTDSGNYSAQAKGTASPTGRALIFTSHWYNRAAISDYVVEFQGQPSTPAAGNGPVVNSHNVLDITQNSARINFIVSEKTQAYIEYGTTTAYGQRTTEELSFTYDNHLQGISGLASATTYYYQVNVTNQAGQTGSATGSFTTSGAGN